MKKIIFNIACLIGLVAFMSSCQKDPVFEIPAQMVFDFPNVTQTHGQPSGQDVDLIRAVDIHLVTYTINPFLPVLGPTNMPTGNNHVNPNHSVTQDGNIMTIQFGVKIPIGSPSRDVPFTITVLDPNSVHITPESPNPATSTLAPEAFTLQGSGVVPAGSRTARFQITIDHAHLSATATQNDLFLLLSVDPASGVRATENMRRVRLRFARAASAPVLTATTVTPGIFSAIASSSVTSPGLSAVTEAGIIFSTASTFTLTTAGVVVAERTPTGTHGTGPITNAVTGNVLSENTAYFARSFAINATDTAYGPIVSFTTVAFNGGTTTVNAPNFIRKDTATVIMSLTAVNDTTFMNNVTGALRDTIQETGIVWAFNIIPTLADNTIVSNLTRMGTDTLTMATNFTTAGDLIVRAYAVSFSGNTSFSSAQTIRVRYPVGETRTATAVTDSSATLHGYLDFNGGAVLAEAGFEVSTSPTLAVIDHVFNVTTVPTAAMSQITGGVLSSGTTYYYRAFFVNRFGLRSYGEIRSFTTQ
ncbi:MAG: hypothetical protein FWD02_00895 [Bacteroidales bacterium]|nr:hypothetical protein [Bacteroidales bacterium]